MQKGFYYHGITNVDCGLWSVEQKNNKYIKGKTKYEKKNSKTDYNKGGP